MISNREFSFTWLDITTLFEPVMAITEGIINET